MSSIGFNSVIDARSVSVEDVQVEAFGSSFFQDPVGHALSDAQQNATAKLDGFFKNNKLLVDKIVEMESEPPAVSNTVSVIPDAESYAEHTDAADHIIDKAGIAGTGVPPLTPEQEAMLDKADALSSAEPPNYEAAASYKNTVASELFEACGNQIENPTFTNNDGDTATIGEAIKSDLDSSIDAFYGYVSTADVSTIDKVDNLHEMFMDLKIYTAEELSVIDAAQITIDSSTESTSAYSADTKARAAIGLVLNGALVRLTDEGKASFEATATDMFYTVCVEYYAVAPLIIRDTVFKAEDFKDQDSFYAALRDLNASQTIAGWVKQAMQMAGS